MGMKTVAIIGALDEEVALIAKSLTHVTHTAKGSLDIVSGTVDSFGSDVIKVAATVGGMGLVNAAATTQLLIDEFAPDVVILCICRACQGVGLAGEWSGAALVATENAPADKRALYGSFPNLGAPIGFFCAYGLNLLLESNLSKEQMIAFGWRIPFLCSAVLVIIGLYVRARMSETPVFQKATEEKRTSKHPLRDLLPYWKEVVLGTVAMGITYTLFYVLGTWSLAYGVKGLGFQQGEYLLMQMCSVVFFAIFIVVSCVYADKVGRKKVMIAVTEVALVSSFFVPMLLVHSAAHIMIFLCVGFMIMGGLFGPCGAYLPELFPVHVRYSGAGLSYNLAAIFGGAFAPTIAQALVASKFGVAGVGWYMAIMAALALLALFLIKESKDKDYEL